MLRASADGWGVAGAAALDLAVQIARRARGGARGRGSCTATSSPRTSWSRRTAASRSSTSASRRRSSTEAAHSNLATASVGTEAGVVLGTVAYMSPEQASGQKVDFRSDQFALGSDPYDLDGRRESVPRGPTAPQTLSAIIADDPCRDERRPRRKPAGAVCDGSSSDVSRRTPYVPVTPRLGISPAELRNLRDHLGDLAPSGVRPRARAAGRRFPPACSRPPRFSSRDVAAGIIAGTECSGRLSLDRSDSSRSPSASRDRVRAFRHRRKNRRQRAWSRARTRAAFPCTSSSTVRPGTPEARPLAGITGEHPRDFALR